MKLELLKTFLAVIDGGSIRGAARLLKQSQPGVSKKIRLLEESLGVALFVRSTQGIELTRFGEHLLTRARAIVNETDRAEQEIAELRGELEGTVRLMVAPGSTIDIIPETVRIFHQSHPNTRLELFEGLQSAAVEQIRQNQIDFALCPLWEALPFNEFVIEPVQQMQMAILANAQSRFNKARKLEELIDANWIHVGAGASLSPLVVRLFQQQGISTPAPKMESYSMSSTLAMLFASDAVALLPKKVAEQSAYRHQLIALPIEDNLPVYELNIIFRKESPLTPSARALATLIHRVANSKKET